MKRPFPFPLGREEKQDAGPTLRLVFRSSFSRKSIDSVEFKFPPPGTVVLRLRGPDSGRTALETEQDRMTFRDRRARIRKGIPLDWL